DVRLDLPEAEFKDLGSSFDAVSAQLSESRAKSLTKANDFESVVSNLEDAVALFSPEGRPMLSNPAMSSVLPDFVSNATVGALVERTLASRQPQGPTTVLSSPTTVPGSSGLQAGDPDSAVNPVDPERTEILLITHPIDDGR